MPELVEEYESHSRAGTIVHDIVGRPAPDVTLRPAGTRYGRLRMTFTDEAAAWDAEQALRSAAVFEWTSPLPTTSMTFVPQEDITRRWVSTGRWIVDTGYREITL